MKVRILDTRKSPRVGLLEKDRTYDLDEDFARQLIRQNLAVSEGQPTKKKRSAKGKIDLSDGVSDEEAELAGRTLSQRSNEED